MRLNAVPSCVSSCPGFSAGHIMHRLLWPPDNIRPVLRLDAVFEGTRGCRDGRIASRVRKNAFTLFILIPLLFFKLRYVVNASILDEKVASSKT